MKTKLNVDEIGRLERVVLGVIGNGRTKGNQGRAITVAPLIESRLTVSKASFA
jgi:hypothetical protein